MIRARVLEPGAIMLEDVDTPIPAEGEALIAVESCGLCGSDLSLFTGRHPVIKPPMVLGHEVIGTIVEARPRPDDDLALQPGSRVALLPQTGCGECAACLRQDWQLCPEMRLIGGQLPGGMAELFVAPLQNLMLIPDSVPPETRAVAEPLAVACHAVRRGCLQGGESVLVLGGGPIGVFVALVAQTGDARDVVVVEPLAARRRIVRRLGLNAVEAIPESGSFDVAFDCVGGDEAPVLALGSVPPGGRIVLVGVAAAELRLDGILLQRQERSVSGSQMYTRADFAEALRLLAEGILPLDPESLDGFIDRRRLADIVRVMDDFTEHRSTGLKTVVVP